MWKCVFCPRSALAFKSMIKKGKMLDVAQGPRVIEDPPDKVKGAPAVRVYVKGFGRF